MNPLELDADMEPGTRAATLLRARLAAGAALIPKLGAAALVTFLVVGVGAPWLLYDAPPSPYEAFALRALCRDAAHHPRAGCPASTASAQSIAAPGSLRDRLK